VVVKVTASTKLIVGDAGGKTERLPPDTAANQCPQACLSELFSEIHATWCAHCRPQRLTGKRTATGAIDAKRNPFSIRNPKLESRFCLAHSN
jgi:hypothetical protein